MFLGGCVPHPYLFGFKYKVGPTSYKSTYRGEISPGKPIYFRPFIGDYDYNPILTSRAPLTKTPIYIGAPIKHPRYNDRCHGAQSQRLRVNHRRQFPQDAIECRIHNKPKCFTKKSPSTSLYRCKICPAFQELTGDWLELPPTQDSSHHQDYSIFSIPFGRESL